MNDDDDDNLEARLARWQPAEPPPGMLRRFSAMESTARPERVRRRWFGTMQHPWPLAYAGLLAAWALILILRLLTPTSGQDPAGFAPLAQTDPDAATAPAVAANLPAQRAFFFSRRTPDQL